MPFRHLLSGFDTIECAYYLEATRSKALDFQLLMTVREELRQLGNRFPFATPLGCEEFLMASHGTKSGYPFLLQNDAFTIQCGEFNKPNFFVAYRSHALWHQGAVGLHQRFLRWAESVGMAPYRTESLSRVDFTFDYLLPDIDFGVDDFITSMVKDNQHRKNKKVQTFTFGASPVVLRIYNKSDEIAESSQKTWFYPLWNGQQDNVWRIEWEVRKDVLREQGVRTFDDLIRGSANVLRPLVNEKVTLRVPTDDSNCSRWPLHPLWSEFQQRVDTLGSIDIVRDSDPQAELEERLMRVGVSVYGYMKRIAAIHGLQRGVVKVELEETIERLQKLLLRIHNPLTWEDGVQDRMNEMRLGQR